MDAPITNFKIVVSDLERSNALTTCGWASG